METKLFHDLPSLIEGEHYIIFSPYAKKIAKINSAEAETEETLSILREQGFFGQPSEYRGQHSEYYQLVIIITSDCNLRCKYCFADGGKKVINITPEIIEKAVDTAIANMKKNTSKKGLLVTFFGGEPSLRMDMIKYTMDYVEKQLGDAYKSAYSITTNGVFNENTLKFLVDNHFFVTISMDGFPEIQDRQRPLPSGEGTSKYVEKTIRRLREENADFLVKSVITAESVDGMPALVKYLAELGAQKLHFEAVSLAGRAMESPSDIQRPDPSVFADKLIECIEIAKTYNISIMNSAFMNILTPSVHFCDKAGCNKLVVTYDGYYTTCIEVQDNCHPAVDKFMIGDYRSKMASQPADNTPAIEKTAKCKTCFAKYVCSGGCPSRNYHTNGDIDTVDEFRCTVIKKLLTYCIMKIYKVSTQA